MKISAIILSLFLASNAANASPYLVAEAKRGDNEKIDYDVVYENLNDFKAKSLAAERVSACLPLDARHIRVYGSGKKESEISEEDKKSIVAEYACDKCEVRNSEEIPYKMSKYYTNPMFEGVKLFKCGEFEIQIDDSAANIGYKNGDVVGELK